MVTKKRVGWFSAILSRGVFLSGSDSTWRFFVCKDNLFAIHGESLFECVKALWLDCTNNMLCML